MSDDLILQIETTEQELELVLEEQSEEIDLPVLMLSEVGPPGPRGESGNESDTNYLLIYSIAKL